jgi:hypothetical protein
MRWVIIALALATTPSNNDIQCWSGGQRSWCTPDTVAATLDEFVTVDGTRPLTADWDAGSFEVRAQTFESDVTTGTAPLVCASTTLVTNLNADMLDGVHGAAYSLVTDIDDAPVNGVIDAPISSNWAYDHVAAADPHTGYRLESVDHTHQSTGAQAGQLDHGLALTGLTDDDHTQYALLAGRSGGQILRLRAGESTTKTNYTQALSSAGLIIETDYTANAYTPGIYWSTVDDNPTKPKAGIFIRETSNGTFMFVGTSGAYGTGITNDAIIIDPSGAVVLDGASAGRAFKGAGTLNAAAIYDDGAGPLTGYVLDAATRGIDPNEWDAMSQAAGSSGEHRQARDFADRLDQLDPSAYAAEWKARGELPAFPTRQEWIEGGGLPLGSMVQRLWETVEVQAVHIDNLNQRIMALEAMR